MDTMAKQNLIEGHSAVDHSATNLLFRPWDCKQNQSQLAVSNNEKAVRPEENSKMSNSTKMLSSKMIFSPQEQLTKMNSLMSTETLSFPTAAAAAAFAMSHQQTPTNVSLMSSTGHHHYQPHKQFGHLPPPPNVGANLNGINPLKSASEQCQPMSFPPLVPDNSMAGFMSGTVPVSNRHLFSFPNLFAYNAFNAAAAAVASFHASGHHHQHSHYQSHHLETLMSASNKVALQLSSGNPSVAQLEKLTIEQHQNGLLERTPKKQRPKRFQCPHCPTKMANAGQLRGHLRTHTGERPFACDICKRDFSRREELTRHSRTHTGLKPYSCEICNKSFGRKDHLKKHVKTHQRPPPISMPLSLDPALSYAALAYSWL